MGPLIINGRYEVLAELGRGGMGIVYRARQKSLDRIVAIKMLSRELAGDPEFCRRFQQEAQVIARLQHENIVSVFDIDQDRGTFFIIMEYVEGVSLQQMLRAQGALSPELSTRLIAQVARALGYAHDKGIIHRDIKPDNIMVVGGEKAMVMDFGIARVSDSTLKTQTGVAMGTPKYMAPEQVRGQHVDARSDLYSLGVVLYAAATGTLPFDGDSPFTIAIKHMQEEPPPPTAKAAHIPAALERAILRALAKAPEARFQTGEEFAQALEAAVSPGGPMAQTRISSFAPIGQTEENTPTVESAAIPSIQGSAEFGSAATSPSVPLKAIADPPAAAIADAQSAVAPAARAAKRWPIRLAAAVFALALLGGLAWLGARNKPAPPRQTAATATPASTLAQPPAAASAQADSGPTPGSGAEASGAPGAYSQSQQDQYARAMDLIGSAVREFETAVKVKGTPLDQGAIEKTATIVQEAVEMLIDARGGGNDPMPLALAQRLLWMNERLMAASRIDALAIYRRVGERFPAFALIRRDYLEGDARPGRLGGGGPQARPGERPLGNWGRGPSASPPANN